MGDTRSLELLWARVETAQGTLFIGALYHPPTPIYDVQVLLDCLERTIEFLTELDANATIILGGDLNQLSDTKVVEYTGLTPMVTQPTRGKSILDRLYISEPRYSVIRVVTSSIKTDHRAIVATSDRSSTYTDQSVFILFFFGDAHQPSMLPCCVASKTWIFMKC